MTAEWLRVQQILEETWPGLTVQSVKHKADGRMVVESETMGAVTCWGCPKIWTFRQLNDMGHHEIRFHFGPYDPDTYRLVDDKRGFTKLEVIPRPTVEEEVLATGFDMFGG